MPQTYGPFERPAVRDDARELVLGARQAWARDARSYSKLQALLGDDFDAGRHRQGVDMAFGLWAEAFDAGDKLGGWLRDARSAGTTLVGINVSGLLDDGEAARGRFGLAGDYTATIEALVHELLSQPDVRVVLVPHVHAPVSAIESDLRASLALQERVLRRAAPGAADRLEVLLGAPTATELKWLVAQFDWFCGARMHATIAGLSSGVATVGLAYSDKAEGVFASCGAEAGLLDLRTCSEDAVVEGALSHFVARVLHGRRLRRGLPELRQRLTAQHAAILEAIGGSRADAAA